MNPQDVQTAIIATITGAVSGLRTYDYASPAPQPPCLDVVLALLSPADTFDPASARAIFTVRIIVGAINEAGSQSELYGYITPGSSVIGALQDDPTFSGAVSDSSIGDIRVTPVSANEGATKYWSAEIPVEVKSLE